MTHYIDLQIAYNGELPAAEEQLKSWALAALRTKQKPCELTLRFVSSDEIQELNKIYRQKDKPTNVLAFPSELPEIIELEYQLLGDVIICPAILRKESEEQEKPLDAHWAHIIIHGVLHLLGYDHITDADAKIMQEQEILLLAEFGYPDPY